MMKYADNSFVSNPGSPIKVLYAPHVEENGAISLVESGVENLQEYIDSFRDSSDVSSVVTRFLNTGDPTVLQVKQGQYGDFTAMPKTYAEALQLKIDADRMYDSLPASVKEKFNNDRNQFFAMSGTEEWYANLGEMIPQPEKAESEVKE